MIQIYSTDTKTKMPLKTRRPNQLTMYVCGPTVYDRSHIGHARPAVTFDTVRRYLEYAGYTVLFISNITDVDDKIIARAKQLGLTPQTLTSRYQDEYERDMSALGVRAPTIRPKATEHIAEMIDLIRGLEEKGIAYATPRGMWFDVSKFPAYGKLSGRVVDDEHTEHRVEQDADKRNPQDFALWKASKPGEPEWDSPWGKGRPGWHLECSAMAGKYADFELDIHGGGADLCFPHHENEIAQSEAFSGKPFATFWMHNGFITIDKSGEKNAADGDDEAVKMGKSKGNAFWLADAFTSASPAALRLWILGTHYRTPLSFNPEFILQAQGTLERFYNCLDSLDSALTEQTADDIPADLASQSATLLVDFNAAMADDFNTPQALASLHELIGKTNTLLAETADKAILTAARNAIQVIMGVLGLPLSRPVSASAENSADAFIDLLAELRDQARADKNFALSDTIRDRLAALGVEVRDGKDKTAWKWQ